MMPCPKARLILLHSRNETTVPHGARPNRPNEALLEGQVGCIVESYLKQKEGYC